MRSSDAEIEFEQFFLERYERLVQSVALVCGDRQRAEDATQEAFIRAYARWRRLRRYDNPAAWVRRVAINLSHDAHRADSSRSRREERAAPVEATTNDSDGSALDLLAGLPDRQRAIAALYYLDDLPVAEIAELLDIADGTVRFHLSQARERLRRHLHPDRQDGHAPG